MSLKTQLQSPPTLGCCQGIINVCKLLHDLPGTTPQQCTKNGSSCNEGAVGHWCGEGKEMQGCRVGISGIWAPIAPTLFPWEPEADRFALASAAVQGNSIYPEIPGACSHWEH